MSDPVNDNRLLEEPVTEILIQPDGSVLLHNLTAGMAAALAPLNPADRLLQRRAAFGSRRGAGSRHTQPVPELP